MYPRRCTFGVGRKVSTRYIVAYLAHRDGNVYGSACSLLLLMLFVRKKYDFIPPYSDISLLAISLNIYSNIKILYTALILMHIFT